MSAEEFVAVAAKFPLRVVMEKEVPLRQSGLPNSDPVPGQRIRPAPIYFAGDNRPRASGAPFSLSKRHNFQPRRRSPAQVLRANLFSQSTGFRHARSENRLRRAQPALSLSAVPQNGL